MNGNITIQGSFTIETNSNFLTLKFLNIDQPYGNNTSGSSNGINYVSFNTAKIGQLVLFQENSTSAPGDILSLLSYPITPEATTNIFKRLN